MATRRFLFFAIVLAGCSQTLAKAEAPVAADKSASSTGESRSLHKNKLCKKYGICNGGGFGGYGGYGGYQGNQNYQGYQPPVNIAISQSQSSANEGGGGHGSGYFPNNYQYNGGYPNGYSNQGYYNQGYYNQGYYNQGYSGYDGYGGYNRPGFGNGYGAYNNQFNGNYYSGYPNGAYGFQSPFGFRDDIDGGGEGGDYDDGSPDSFAYARNAAAGNGKQD